MRGLTEFLRNISISDEKIEERSEKSEKNRGGILP
jgi:hypothetical protein